MGEKLDSMEPQVREHLIQLVKTTDLPETEETLEMMAHGWLEKQDAFLAQTKARNMEEVDTFRIDDPRGGLALTYSGSLLAIGPEAEDGRLVEYSSIGLRRDVPESSKLEGSALIADVNKDSVAEFDPGPISKSSPVYAIAQATEEMDPEEEQNLLQQVTMMVAEDFVQVNKTIIDGE